MEGQLGLGGSRCRGHGRDSDLESQAPGSSACVAATFLAQVARPDTLERNRCGEALWELSFMRYKIPGVN